MERKSSGEYESPVVLCYTISNEGVLCASPNPQPGDQNEGYQEENGIW